jgi:hypothetical protein
MQLAPRGCLASLFWSGCPGGFGWEPEDKLGLLIRGGAGDSWGEPGRAGESRGEPGRAAEGRREGSELTLTAAAALGARHATTPLCSNEHWEKLMAQHVPDSSAAADNSPHFSALIQTLQDARGYPLTMEEMQVLSELTIVENAVGAAQHKLSPNLNLGRSTLELT